MRILIVAATGAEIDPLVAGLRYRSDGDSHVTSYTRAAHAMQRPLTAEGRGPSSAPQ